MKRIIITKLILQGTAYKRTLKFKDGLNIISGDKTSGKSLVLSLIDYCLGKSKKIDLNVQKQLDRHCDQIFLELLINKETITLSRLLKQKQGKIGIYYCKFNDLEGYTPKTVDIKEVMHFLMRKLDVNEYKLIKHKKHSTKQELEKISFRDIFRYSYVHQHELGTHDFLENKSTFKRYKNPYAFELMFNLVETNKNYLQEQLVKVRNEIEDTNKEITGLKSYLKDKDAENFSELSSKATKFKDEIEQYKQEKNSIIKNSKANSNNENIMYIRLKKDLTEIANQIFDLQKQKKELQNSIRAKRLLLEEYKFEKEEINATLEINYKLSIPEQKIECPLCNSTVANQIEETTKGSVTPEKTLLKIKKEINNKVNLVNNLISDDNRNIEGIEIGIDKLAKKQGILNKAIAEFAKSTDVPFLSQLDSINSIINKLTRNQEIVKECVRIHRKVAEKCKQIEDLNKEVNRLEKDIAASKVSQYVRKQIFDFLNTEYKGFMKRLKYDINNETYIDSEKYIPYHEGASVYEHESGGLLECMQLSYLAAILSSKKEGYAVGHPGFLMLDTLSKYLGTIQVETEEELKIKEEERINDPEVYEEIYQILIELSNKYQIIIVDNTPPEKVTKYTEYTFFAGEKGLVNINVNEFNEED